MAVTWRSGNEALALFASFLAALLLCIGTFRSSIYSALPYSPRLSPPSLSLSLAVIASISPSASSPPESSFTPPQSSAAPYVNTKTCPPRSTSLSTETCPKTICVASTSPGAGLGHRLTEYLLGIILSQTFGVDIAIPSFDHPGQHGGYPGANQLFYPRNPGWNVPRCSIPPVFAGGTCKNTRAKRSQFTRTRTKRSRDMTSLRDASFTRARASFGFTKHKSRIYETRAKLPDHQRELTRDFTRRYLQHRARLDNSVDFRSRQTIQSRYGIDERLSQRS